jgi:hypothetical protein
MKPPVAKPAGRVREWVPHGPPQNCSVEEKLPSALALTT